jgi:predicted permease
MPALSRITSFWRNAFSRRRNDRDLDAEVRSYYESLAEEKMRQGLSSQDARRAARLESGGIEQLKEEVRDVRAGAWFESLLQDLRYGARMLRKKPGFTAIAVLTLALGIGANTAMFTLADAVLIRPLPYHAPNQLVWITEQSSNGDSTGVSWPDFQDWKGLNTVFSGMAGYRDARMSLAGNSYPALISGRYVTANYFELMGISPILGRTFQVNENAEGGPQVAILSYEFWQREYGGSPAILGQTLRLDNHSFTVVGVMPKGFGAVTQTALWAPFEQNVPKIYLTSRQYAWLLYIVGRTKPGTSLTQVQLDMQRVGQLLAQQYPDMDSTSRPFLRDLRSYMLGDNRALVILLMTAVALLLAITCANLTGLLLVRMTSRQRELSLRRALGASKQKILQQIFTEGLLLALAGSLIGTLAAWTAIRFAAAVLPNTLPMSGPLTVDARALLFTFAASLLSSFVFGFAPARSAMRTDPQTVLRSSSYHLRGSNHRLHAGLIVCEIGLAMAVLVGAGLLVRTMVVLLKTKVGFDTSQLLTASVIAGRAETGGSPQITQFAQQGLERIERLPGVESAATVFPLPFTPQIDEVWLAVEGRVPQPGIEQTTYVSVVSSSYFDTMKIPLLQGRAFQKQEESPDSRSVLIDEGLARQYWPGQNPVGKSIKMGTQDFSDKTSPAFTIVGVVAPVRAGSLDTAPEFRVYTLVNQNPVSTMSFVVRTKIDPHNLAREVQNAIHAANPNVPVFNLTTMDDAIQSSQAPRRLAMLLLLAFSLAALLLATMGLYGVMSYLAAQRTNEIGIRMALGAEARDILRLILRYGTALILAGAAAGFVASVFLAQLMKNILYGVQPIDPLTFAASAAIIATAALLACYIPARRAIRVDPMVALRYE